MASDFMGIAPCVPDLGHDPLPVTPYLSQEIFEGERKHIYSQVWLNVVRNARRRPEIPAFAGMAKPNGATAASSLVIPAKAGISDTEFKATNKADMRVDLKQRFAKSAPRKKHRTDCG